MKAEAVAAPYSTVLFPVLIKELALIMVKANKTPLRCSKSKAKAYRQSLRKTTKKLQGGTHMVIGYQYGPILSQPHKVYIRPTLWHSFLRRPVQDTLFLISPHIYLYEIFCNPKPNP